MGDDGIPIEVYKVSVPTFKFLHDLLVIAWKEEYVRVSENE